MTLLHFISFLATLLALAFFTLCLASGLLYLAEIIEEHSQSAKKIGRQIVHAVIFIHLAIYFSDGLPLGLTLLGVSCHLVYLTNFSKSWPYISLTSPSFIASCLLVIIDHFAWFFYFTDRARDPIRHHPIYRSSYRPAWDDQFSKPRTDRLTFLDVTTFFALCVWLVPFFLFLSLSANDNVLPSLSGDQALGAPLLSAQPPTPTRTCQEITYDPNKLNIDSPILQTPRSSLLKGLLQSCLTSLPAVRRHPFQAGRTSSRPNEGLIASPSISSPSSPALAWPHHHHPGPSTPLSASSFSLMGRSPPSTPPNSVTTPSPRRPFVAPTSSRIIQDPPSFEMDHDLQQYQKLQQKRSSNLRERTSPLSAGPTGHFPPPKRRASALPTTGGLLRTSVMLSPSA